LGKKTLIFVLAGFVGLIFVSTVYCSLSVTEYPRFPFQKQTIGDQTGTNVVGVGPTPSAAVEDGIRQIRQLFGRFFISSETVVREGILERDVIIEKGSFRGSKLDRFYEGVFCRSDEYFAVFRFSSDFVKAVRLREKDRDKGFSKFFASFDAITYSTISIDSFGEEVRKEWVIKVPCLVKRFFDFFIWHTEDIGNIEIVTENG
jgi:hypothetical protein